MQQDTVRQADTNQVGKHFFYSKREVKKTTLQKYCKKCTTLNLQNHNTKSTEKMM